MKSLTPSLVKSPMTGGDTGTSGIGELASTTPSGDTTAIDLPTASIAFLLSQQIPAVNILYIQNKRDDEKDLLD